jgi:membrane fusion protein
MPDFPTTDTPARTPLFRQQALDGARHKLHGDILLARPVSFSALTSLFAVVAICIVAFFAFFGYTRKAQVVGVVAPSTGVARVVAGQAGTIVERRVEEGQNVQAGAVLFVLSSERASAERGEAESAIGALLETRRANFVTERAQASMQGRQRLQATERRARDLATEIPRIDNQIGLQKHRVALAEEGLKRYQNLAAVSFISQAQLQDKTAELIDQQQRLQDLERARGAAERELATARAELQDQQAQAKRDELAIQRSIASIDQDLTENETRRRIVIRAPQDGQMAAVTAEAGQAVAANQVLASLVPEGATLEAELYAPSRAVGFLRAGMPVLIRYQAFPYQKFGQHEGRIREVSRTALRPEDIAASTSLPQSGNGEALYRVRVALDQPTVMAYGAAQPLKPGMALDASVVLEERKLYEWALEPLFSITGKL